MRAEAYERLVVCRITKSSDCVRPVLGLLTSLSYDVIVCAGGFCFDGTDGRFLSLVSFASVGATFEVGAAFNFLLLLMRPLWHAMQYIPCEVFANTRSSILR